ncbi:MAG: hypothetical protein KKF27_20610 [Gammaproteobacteria bacterium]|nr:hypothetical protein [Gammaproteobacteria bacterium]
MDDLDESIKKLLEQEKILLSVLGQAKAKLEISKSEIEIDKYKTFIEKGLALMEQVEKKLELIFGKRSTAGDN